ncbi:MAG: methylated-DNA--[protein]-cysteine S-methyltransferase [Idiomarina sp.]|nr:methylated-DNA--[protein]-cysteine S-methyltransferase [Idiomarina sp.]
MLLFGRGVEPLAQASRLADALRHECVTMANRVSDLCKAELAAYFAGDLKEFKVPLAPSGTEFQRRVWDALVQIPYGVTCSYRELAQAAQCEKGYQAVGQANGRNPIPIIIPCHRVISADGGLGGYSGGLSIKKQLLQLEGWSRA